MCGKVIRFHGFTKEIGKKKNPVAVRNNRLNIKSVRRTKGSSKLLIRNEGIPQARAFTLTKHRRFKFAQRATYFSVKCIPHPRLFVKVLHGIAVKRCRGPKDTTSIRHRGGCKKKQRARTGFRVLLDRARCPIANSSHLFGPPALREHRRRVHGVHLDPKVTKLIYPNLLC